MAIRKGFEVPDERITMNALFDQWLDSVKARRQPKTFVSYAQVVRDYVRPEPGRVRVSSLRPHHVEPLLEKVPTMVPRRGLAAGGGGRGKQRVRELSPRSVAYVRDVLRIDLVSRLLSPANAAPEDGLAIHALEARCDNCGSGTV